MSCPGVSGRQAQFLRHTSFTVAHNSPSHLSLLSLSLSLSLSACVRACMCELNALCFLWYACVKSTPFLFLPNPCTVNMQIFLRRCVVFNTLQLPFTHSVNTISLQHQITCFSFAFFFFHGSQKLIEFQAKR